MKKYFTLIAMMFAAGATFAQDEVEFGDNIFPEGNFEGEVSAYAYSKPNQDNPGGEINLAVPQEGIGVDGTKGVAVVSAAGASADWDSQFWIAMPDEVSSRKAIHVTFQYRAEWEDGLLDANEEPIEVINIGTQGHNAPGTYLNNNGFGTLEFTKEWQTYEGTIYKSADVYSVAFNLAQNNHDFDVTFYFDNITIQIEKDNEEIQEYQANLVRNGNFEEEDASSFIVHSPRIEGYPNPEIIDGIGVDDSRGIQIVSPASSEGKGDDWDTQFWIMLSEPLSEGTSFDYSFDMKASVDGANVDTQTHSTTPGSYIHWACVGSPSLTTEWKTFSGSVTVSSDMASKEANGQPFQSIAFNLSKTKDQEVTYYLDNISIKVWKTASIDDNPERIELEETLAAIEDAYNGGRFDAIKLNKNIREEFQALYDEAKDAEEDCLTYKDQLESAKTKFAASVSDYNNLLNFINWLGAKKEVADEMGDHYEDLSTELDNIWGELYAAYDAEEWTREEINANTSQSAIRAKIAAYIGANVKDGDDITIMVENPSFAGNTNGWQRDGGSKFLDYGPSNRNTLDPNFEENGGFLPTGMAEVWHGSFNAYQTLTDLPTGLYSISVNACQRGDDGSDETALFYATVNGAETHMSVMSVYDDPAPEMLFDTDGIMQNGQTNSGTWPSIEAEGGWIPNGKGSANYHLNAGYYLNTLNVLVNEAGDIRFGIKDTNTTGWCVMDNFKVVYHSLDNKLALAAALEALVGQAEEVQNGGLTDPADDALYKSITTAENVAKNVENETKESIDAAYSALLAAIDDAKANAKAIAEVDAIYLEKFAGVYDEFKENATPDAAKRADEADANYSNTMSMTTDELKAYADELNYLLDALLVPGEAADATDDAPYDLTDAILVQKGIDVDFEDYSAIGANKDYPGWAGSKFGTGGGTAGPVGERWNQTNGFNTYVNLKGLPEGMYTLTCDGGYRLGSAGNINDYNFVQAGTIDANVPYLYATTSEGTEKTYLPNVYSVLVTEEIAAEQGIDFESGDNARITVTDTLGNSTRYVTPQQLATADQFMKLGYYNANKVVFKVGADGNATIGVRKEKGASNDWTFVDNFKLEYLGANSTAVPTAIEGIANVPAVKAIYTISGVRVSNLNKAGIYIVNGKKLMVK